MKHPVTTLDPHPNPCVTGLGFLTNPGLGCLEHQGMLCICICIVSGPFLEVVSA